MRPERRPPEPAGRLPGRRGASAVSTPALASVGAVRRAGGRAPDGGAVASTTGSGPVHGSHCPPALVGPLVLPAASVVRPSVGGRTPVPERFGVTTVGPDDD